MYSLTVLCLLNIPLWETLINVSFFPHHCISCTWTAIVSVFLPMLSLGFSIVLQQLASYLIFVHSFNKYPLYLYYKVIYINISSVQFSPMTQPSATLCNPMDCSTPGLPVHHQLPEPTQTHVHWVNDAIQPSHTLSSPSPLALSLSQHQGLFQMSQLFASGGQSTGVAALASVLPMNIQDLSPLGWTGWISLQSKGLSRVFSNTTVQKHQFFGAQLSL